MKKTILILLSWFLTAFVLIPQLIDYLYLTLRPQFVIDLVEKYPIATLEYIQDQWMLLAITSLMGLILILIYSHQVHNVKFQEKFVGQTSAATIGAIRMLVMAILLISVIWEDLPSTAYLPREMGKPVGIMNLFMLIPGFEWFLSNYIALSIFEGITTLLIFMGMIGLFTRKTLPLASLAYLIFAGIFRHYSWFYHTGLIPLLVSFVLCIIPSGDGWSVDSLIKKWKYGATDSSTSQATYGWARYAIWMVVALPYVGAGLSKLRNGGLLWWEATNFKHIMLYCNVRPMEFDFDMGIFLLDKPDFLFEIMAIIALAGEALYGFVLVSKKARFILPLAMLLMHIGILFLQNILFFDLIILQIIFWDLKTPLARFSQYWNNKYGTYSLDLSSEGIFWRRLGLIIQSLDLFTRIEINYNSASQVELSHATGNWKNQDALIKISWLLPALWPIAPFIWIGLKLHLLTQKTLDSLKTFNFRESTKDSSFSKLKLSQLTLYLLIIFTTAWVFKIEAYPLTAMQMFSRIRDNIITYEIVEAHYASGKIERAPIEKSIKAMSDARYRKILIKAFDPNKSNTCHAFLNACAERWNESASESDRIIKMEVKQFEWDFVNDRDNPNHGNILNQKAFELSTFPLNELDTAIP